MEAVDYLTSRLVELVKLARTHHVCLCIDSEESYRLPMTLQVIEAVISSEACRGWQGLGMAVQAYQKCALDVLKWLKTMLTKHKAYMSVRLVKGAYWDSEIKEAQLMGILLSSVYPEASYRLYVYELCKIFITIARCHLSTVCQS